MSLSVIHLLNSTVVYCLLRFIYSSFIEPRTLLLAHLTGKSLTLYYYTPSMSAKRRGICGETAFARRVLRASRLRGFNRWLLERFLFW